MSLNVELRPAIPSDLEFLSALRRTAMYEHLERAGVAIEETEQYARVLHRFDCARIVVVDGRPAGLLKVAQDVRPWELIQVQIAPELRGRGLGARLIRGVLDDARIAGAEVELSVLKGNPARRLYDRLGFVLVGENAVAHFMRWSPPAAGASASGRT